MFLKPFSLSNWINNNSISADHEELPTSHESSTENVRNASNSSDEQNSNNLQQDEVVRNALSLLTSNFGQNNVQNSNNSQSNVQNGLKKSQKSPKISKFH